MPAKIVDHDDRSPMEGSLVLDLYAVMHAGDRSARFTLLLERDNLEEARQRFKAERDCGQLWERLAEWGDSRGATR